VFEYKTTQQSLQLGSRELQIEVLASLDQTIDDLFDHLQKSGRESDLDSLCPYFGVIWPSALALAEKLATLPLEGKTILEIGCGLALPSLLATQMGAQVTATDSHPDVPRFLENNLKLNRLQGLNYTHAHWAQSSTTILVKPNLIMGSDILYEKDHPRLVAEFINLNLAAGGSAIVTDPARPYLQTFSNEMKARKFKETLEIKTVQTPTEKKDIFVLSFSR